MQLAIILGHDKEPIVALFAIFDREDQFARLERPIGNGFDSFHQVLVRHHGTAPFVALGLDDPLDLLQDRAIAVVFVLLGEHRPRPFG